MTSKTRQATCYLMFSALSEIMLEMYGNITMLNQYDPNLHTKLKNLKANFERVTKNAYGLFPEDEQVIFFDLINVFEKLIESASDPLKFSKNMGLIKACLNGEVTMINSTEELIATAKLRGADSEPEC